MFAPLYSAQETVLLPRESVFKLVKAIRTQKIETVSIPPERQTNELGKAGLFVCIVQGWVNADGNLRKQIEDLLRPRTVRKQVRSKTGRSPVGAN